MQRLVIATLLCATLAACALSPEDEARAAAIRYVKMRLNTPATAQFVDDPKPQMTKYPDGTVMVIGFVDSQNLLGALTRKAYICEMKRISNSDRWQVNSHIIAPQNDIDRILNEMSTRAHRAR